MRTTIVVDSATPAEVYRLTEAFQQTLKAFDLPRQITTEPTVTVLGMAMGWRSPALRVEHASAVLEVFESNQHPPQDEGPHDWMKV